MRMLLYAFEFIFYSYRLWLQTTELAIQADKLQDQASLLLLSNKTRPLVAVL